MCQQLRSIIVKMLKKGSEMISLKILNTGRSLIVRFPLNIENCVNLLIKQRSIQKSTILRV